ncbi:helix-turn-helix domain-containing protein [Pseudothauera rhizosphaerae]|nr:helix-turn-helix transcriptional regulator [Pseudothauera rhizosphaerae]
MRTFGSRLKAARKEAGLSQAQLARTVGMSQGNLSDIENNHVPTSTFTPKLAAALGVEALWLAEGRGGKRRP